MTVKKKKKYSNQNLEHIRYKKRNRKNTTAIK